MSERFQQLRLLEALLFAAAEPLGPEQLARHLPEQADLETLLEELSGLYANRGVNLVRSGRRWAFRTAADLAPLMRVEKTVERKLSRAAVETLAIVAYHQPVTRGEIEEIRGVALSKGTLDVLLEAGWVKPKGRRRTPGRPVTWGTTEAFLDHFGLEALDALPGAGELKAAGLLDTRPAITALGAQGVVEESAPAAAEEAGADEVQEEDPWEILSSEFGEAPEDRTTGAPSGDEAADPPRESAPGEAAGPRPVRGDKS
jgi:segregation and condensation protein B